MTEYIEERRKEFRESFRKYTDEELVWEFNKQVGVPGVVSTRIAMIGALRDELDSRNLDFSKFGGEQPSMQHRIKLIGKKVVREEKSRRSKNS